METVIVPEPDPQQRAALELALVRLGDGEDADTASRSVWWEAGVAENLEDGAGDDGVR
jgi:hypothetical protein